MYYVDMCIPFLGNFLQKGQQVSIQKLDYIFIGEWISEYGWESTSYSCKPDYFLPVSRVWKKSWLVKNLSFPVVARDSKFFEVQRHESESFSTENFPSRKLKVFWEHSSSMRDIEGWYVSCWSWSNSEKARDLEVMLEDLWTTTALKSSKYLKKKMNAKWSNMLHRNWCSLYRQTVMLNPGDPGPPWGHPRHNVGGKWHCPEQNKHLIFEKHKLEKYLQKRYWLNHHVDKIFQFCFVLCI